MFFSGSIPEAISTAQRTLKLFLVYISDTSHEANELDGKTWSSSQVVELITGNAIALRLEADSADASNFCAIYPVSSSPSITVVGYGGVKIWQHEGYITAEELSRKLEQAMDVFKRQMQQPAVAAMAASLMAGVPASQAPTSSATVGALPPVTRDAQAAAVKEEPDEQAAAVDEPERQAASGRPPVTASVQAAAVSEQAAAPEEPAPTVDKPDEHSPGPEAADKNAEATSSSFSPHHGALVNETGQSKEVQEEPVLGTLDEEEEVKECVEEVSMVKRTEKSQESKVPSKILLQVKLMDGGTIRGEFEPIDDLWTVKAFVDEKQAAEGSSSSSSNYRFAVPFPKRVFTATDYNTPLVDLSLGSRAALILVPAGDSKPLIQRLKPGSPCSGGSSNVGSLLSYLNPFSYWRGNAEDAQPAPLSPAGTGAAAATPSSPSKSSSRRRSGWGANIHTLNHDEDDDLLKRGNKYWNGNSTQFGGKDDDKNK